MKNWIQVLSVLWIHLILVPVIQADYWSIWTGWSECSRTCDGGATFQLRRCIRSRRFTRSCHGETIHYATCNNQPCGTDTTDFRASQCSAHNNELYSGRYLTWLPYTDSTSPCALYCRPQGEKLVHLFAPKVLDGTRCGNNMSDMCINGKCWPVGCDHKLGSTKKIDKCGVCGGSNTCFRNFSSVLSQSEWKEVGYGACSATCGVGFRVMVMSCWNKIENIIVKDDMCDGKQRPKSFTKECRLPVCPNATELHRWMVGPWHDCTQTCGGGFSWRIVRCVQTFVDGTQQIINGMFCPKHAPSKRKSCNNQICPTWYAGQWTPCGVTCGRGLQTREVVCRHDGNTFCDKQITPSTTKNCSTDIPCFDQNDIQEVMTDDNHGKSSDDDVIIHGEHLQKEYITSPKYVVSNWSPCSAICGSGTRWRFVRCQVYLPFVNKGALTDLSDSECSGEKPVDMEPCESVPCYDKFEYRSVGFTPCSKSCLGGVQETIIKCVHRGNGTVVDESMCVEARHPPIERRICNDIICPQRWKVGDFGECSVTCGSGTMVREVECIQEFASGYHNVIRLPDYMCDQPVPTRARFCMKKECLAEWATGNWSRCSATCGTGIALRDVYCTKMIAKDLLVNVTLRECHQMYRPNATRMCNQRKCPKPKIKSSDVQFFQLDKMKRVKLTIGMKVAVLPETTLVFRCPTRGVDPKRIQWYKDGELINTSIDKRVKITHKMTLKVKKSLPLFDDGIYSCKVDSLMASSSVTFSNVYDLFSATLTRKHFISNPAPSKLMERDLHAGSLTHRDPISRRRLPLRLVKSDWNPCSATCGGGLQSRNVSCEIITRDYFEVFPVRYCTQAGYIEPSLIQSCNTQLCVKWMTSEWSECSLHTCIRNLFSYQRRDVNCVTQHTNLTTNIANCRHLGSTPPAEKECLNSECVALWNVSSWTECIGTCGTQGFKSRMLNCIWAKTGLPAGRQCEPIKRPITTKKCRVPPCAEVCVDRSKYCNIVKIMDLCKITNFSTNCCRSCAGPLSKEKRFIRRLTLI